MSSTSITQNKPPLNQELVAQAVNGSKDYHYLMTAIVHESLMLKAGYIPDKIEEPLPEKNPEHWQTKKIHMNAGNLWIFFATEYGHFSPSEAKVIWRYGQVLILRKKLLSQLVSMDCPPDILKFADKGLLNINDYIRIYDFGVRAGQPIFSAFNFSFFKEETIKREIEPHSYDYDLVWLVDDIISDAGNFICGRDKRLLNEAVKDFFEYAKRWRMAVALV